MAFKKFVRCEDTDAAAGYYLRGNGVSVGGHGSTHSLLHCGHHATRHAALLIAKHKTKDDQIRRGRGLQLEYRHFRLTRCTSHTKSHWFMIPGPV